MTKLFMGFISGNDELLKDVKVLDQMIINDDFGYDEIKESANLYGGATIINGCLYSNYQHYNQLMKYDTNVIKMILPPETTELRINVIKHNLDIIRSFDIKEYKSLGYWVGDDSRMLSEYNTIIEFETRLSDLMIEYIIFIMGNIKNEYNQESTAFYFNDSLILV